MSKPRFKAGDLVLYYGGLFRVGEVYTINGFDCFFCTVGWKRDVPEAALTKADWRDVQRITKGGAT